MDTISSITISIIHAYHTSFVLDLESLPIYNVIPIHHHHHWIVFQFKMQGMQVEVHLVSRAYHIGFFFLNNKKLNFLLI